MRLSPQDLDRIENHLIDKLPDNALVSTVPSSLRQVPRQPPKAHGPRTDSQMVARPGKRRAPSGDLLYEGRG